MAEPREDVGDTVRPVTAKDVVSVSERMFVEGFVQAWNVEGVDRLAIVRRLDPPAPDYLMQDGAGEFGLEITELFQDAGRSEGGGSAQRRARGVHADQLTRLAEAYYAQGGLPIRLSVLLLRGDDVETLAEARHPEIVSRLTRARAPSGESAVEIMGMYGERLARLVIWSIPSRDDRFVNYSWWECVNDRVGLAGPLQSAIIDQAIKKKSSKLAGYRQATRRVALLMVVNCKWKGGMCWLSDDLRVLNTEGFDDVYFYVYGNTGRSGHVKRFPCKPMSGKLDG